jgi:hypothetical protein
MVHSIIIIIIRLHYFDFLLYYIIVIGQHFCKMIPHTNIVNDGNNNDDGRLVMLYIESIGIMGGMYLWMMRC